MDDVRALMELSKAIAMSAGERLLAMAPADVASYRQSLEYPREIKAAADLVAEGDILGQLAATGLPVLSEESGFRPGRESTDLVFIVDPLDGTFNFVKGLGPSAVSIALWRRRCPVFGVIYDLAERKLVWGGAGLGAYRDASPIAVSTTTSARRASICTGIPVRVDVQDSRNRDSLWKLVGSFAKVRMFGSAAVSLAHVAAGAADAYSESQIMIWDVAAGLAIVEGAGGTIQFEFTDPEHALNVFAGNGRISAPG